MADPGEGTSSGNHRDSDRNLFDAIPPPNLYESDSEDDFDIPHQDLLSSSSSSETESDEEVTQAPPTEVADRFGWVKVSDGVSYDKETINFTARHPKSSKNIPDGCTQPYNYFSLFLDDNFWHTLMSETNRYARQFFELDSTKAWIARHPKSRYRRWPEAGVTIPKLKKYIGLLLNMGTIKKKALNLYWTVRGSQATPFFNATMPYDEFVLISRMLHLNNIEAELPRGTAGFDPWAKVRYILDRANWACKNYYTPSRNISIDESMVGMRNRVCYIQFMPNKRHARFGVKKFELCDSNGYMYHMELYAGKELDPTNNEGQAFSVVKRLMETSALLNKGYHLYTDNFYTKPRLARFLIQHNTLLTGTVRSNSTEMPVDAKGKRQVGEHVFWKNENVLALAFREKKSQTKPVLAISTGHNALVSTRVIRGKEVRKPELIYDYNSFMGGVDISDKKVYHLASERSTRRYWKKIFHNIIDKCFLNSWILFNQQAEKPISRYHFLVEIVESLCGDTDQHRPTPTQTSRASISEHRLVLLEGKKEKDCWVCSDRSRDKKSSAGRKRSRHWCPACQVGCHERCEERLEHVTDQGTKKRRRH